MASLFAALASLALVVSVTAAADSCNPIVIQPNAQRLQDEAMRFDDVVRQQAGYTGLSRDAYRLMRGSERIVRLVQSGADCERLTRQFYNEVSPTFEILRREHDRLQNISPNDYVRNYFRSLQDVYDDLARSYTQSGPVDVCKGLGGGYQGTCRIINGSGSSVTSFIVGPQGNQCVASNSPMFQPAPLMISNGQGSAAVYGFPGGVAIQNTTLTVYGAGNFVITGYNSAGNFNFRCSP